MIFSKIEFNDEEPLYLQIENYIKSMITSNLLVSDGKLPATRELSKLLGVSRNSVITAYENLEEEGILYTVKGKGTFVSTSNIELLRDSKRRLVEQKMQDMIQTAKTMGITKDELNAMMDILYEED